MTKRIRIGVSLIDGVQTVENLKTVLPAPWRLHPRTKMDATGTVMCVADLGPDESEGRLCGILFRALGDADYDWEEMKNDAVSRDTEGLT